MIEKVNPMHPDKIADRIAGAIVDLAYKKVKDPKVAVEVLIGHGNCKIITESNVKFTIEEIEPIVERIANTNDIQIEVIMAEQDKHLSENQKEKVRCGDNGIFRGMPVTDEQKTLTEYAKDLFNFIFVVAIILNF